MKPRIVQKEQMMLLGLSYYGDPFQSSTGWTEENEIGRLWKRFMAFWDGGGKQWPHIVDPSTLYEVHIESGERTETGNYEVFVGTAISHVDDLPITALVKILPATTYAVFSLSGSQITSDWYQLIYLDWLPQSGYEVSHDYSFQLYDHRFKGLHNLDASILDVYMPIRKL